MNRRGFLAAMLGAAMAPAVVKAENIMKIWTPPTEIILDPYPELGTEPMTLESWMRPDGMNTWMHVAMVKTGFEVAKYVNGALVKDHPVFQHFDDVVVPMAVGKKLILPPKETYTGYLSDLRVTSIARNADQFLKREDPKFTDAYYLGD